MRMKFEVLFVCLNILFVGAVFCANGNVKATKRPLIGHGMPQLFDFENFISSFSKHYSGSLEKLARRSYFLGRAFRVFVAGVKYGLRLQNHYLSINSMSDYSPAEVKKMANKAAAMNHDKGRKSSLKNSSKNVREDPLDLPEEYVPATDEQVKKTLEEIVQEHPNDPAIENLLVEGKKRSRRDTSSVGSDNSSQKELPPRKLSFENLYKANRADAVSEVSSKNIDLNPPGKNAKYRGFVSRSYGVSTQRPRKLNWYFAPSRTQTQVQGYLHKVQEVITHVDGVPHLFGGPPMRSQDPDIVYIDHRKTNCISPPRGQGSCGSCYAFAVISLFEYYYCRTFKTLVPLSEQYVIDCGYRASLSGCDGGDHESALDFIARFGAELRSKYPYTYTRGQCPYPPRINEEVTGYVRVNAKIGLQVPRNSWITHLASGPLMTSINTPKDFLNYGGGIHRATNCGQEDDEHAMLMVGFGMENGESYYIFKNSYTMGWGEDGYYRMSFDSDSNCLLDYAYTFAMDENMFNDIKPTINKRNNNRHISGKSVDKMRREMVEKKRRQLEATQLT